MSAAIIAVRLLLPAPGSPAMRLIAPTISRLCQIVRNAD
jgi:hypothetical protein